MKQIMVSFIHGALDFMEDKKAVVIHSKVYYGIRRQTVFQILLLEVIGILCLIELITAKL